MKRNRFAPLADPAERIANAAQSRRIGELRELLAAGVAGASVSARLVRLALNEAEAMAWQTPVPALVFPLLAEEKLAALLFWSRRQDRVREQSEQIAFAA